MARLIKKTNKNYTNVSNVLTRDKRLSWKARGIFLYMWSQADNWQFYVKEIATHATDGERSLTSGLKELEKYGYLVRKHRIAKHGGFDGMDWILTDDPEISDEHNPQNNIDAKEAENDGKKVQNVSDTKRTGYKTHQIQNGGLSNNNSKHYQEQELTTASNNGQARPDNLAPLRKKIIAYLNQKIGTRYKYNSTKSKKYINARVNEDGYKFEDFKTAIDNKVVDWGHDPKMVKYLRPETLFSPKMEGYVNEKTSVPTGSDYHGFADESYFTDHTKVLDNVSNDDLPF